MKTKEMQVPKQVSYTARLFELEEKIKMVEGMYPKRLYVAGGTGILERHPSSRKQWNINQRFKKRRKCEIWERILFRVLFEHMQIVRLNLHGL